jgi:hypothetical protein
VLHLVKKELKEQDWKKIISCLNITPNSVVAFAIASVMIISIIYKRYMYLTKHCRNTPRPRIEPKVLGKILPPPELGNQGNAINININTSNESLAVTPEAIPLKILLR